MHESRKPTRLALCIHHKGSSPTRVCTPVFFPLLPMKHVRGRILKFEHSILIRRPRVDPRMFSTNQKAKPAINQAEFWVLSANVDNSIHYQCLLEN